MSRSWRGVGDAAYTRGQVMSVSDKPRLAQSVVFGSQSLIEGTA